LLEAVENLLQWGLIKAGPAARAAIAKAKA
jgi:hypothetical protein